MSEYNAINRTGRDVFPGDVVQGKSLASMTMKFPGVWIVNSAGGYPHGANKGRLVGVKKVNIPQGWSCRTVKNGNAALFLRAGGLVVVVTMAEKVVKRMIDDDRALFRFVIAGMAIRLATGPVGTKEYSSDAHPDWIMKITHFEGLQ